MNNYSDLYKNFSEITLPKLTEKELKELKKLKKLGIVSIYSLLTYFPRGYDNRNNLKSIVELSNNEYSVIKAVPISITITTSINLKKIVKAKVRDETGIIDVTWFSSPYVAKHLKQGTEYYFIGTAKRGYGIQMINPEYKIVSSQEKKSYSEILPIYSSTKDIPQNTLRRLIKKFFTHYSSLVFENIPLDIFKNNRLLSRREAFFNIHFPKNEHLLEESKRRFAIEELLILQMGILATRYFTNLNSNNLYKLEDKKNLVKKFLSNLSFTLTTAQKRVITQIYKELSNGKITNRLIQGDVGSGKTIVSMLLLLYMVENGYQGAIMAPTEILATQHYLSNYEKFLELGVKVELLTGSLTPKKKKELVERISSGDVDIIIGTHSLIQDNIIFKKLGLIVIDEQHRFGVDQRKAIRDKGILSNLIVMSATPIPRSLALSIYGDLDVSIIDELPPGRLPIKTKYISKESDLKKMYTFIQSHLSEGRQVYFVAPLIEESEKIALKSIYDIEEEVKIYLPNYRIGILHGKMKNTEKDSVMHDFKSHKLDIIISTTVIEVGVDVPNASIMVISDSERFGLSSLHQLRGRVGRGSHSSYCFLISKSKNENSTARMQIMESTNDGFKIAEEDLKLRKPGEIFGTRQSGLTDFKFIDIINDIKMIQSMREECLKHLDFHKGNINNLYLEIDIREKFKEK